MKKIVLVRHATAVAKDPEKDDFERSLRKTGRKEARAMAEWYLQIDEAPSLFLSSPASRAIETAAIFAKVLGYPKKKIVEDAALYESPEPSDFLTILKSLDDKHESVMVFGHDPSFSQFARFIGEGFGESVPKCGVLGVTVNRRSWSKIRAGDGRVDFFEHPEGLRQRRELAKAARKDMAAKFEAGIVNIIREFGISLTEEDIKTVRRSGSRLAKTFAPRTSLNSPTTAPVGPAKKKTGMETST